MNVDKFYWFCGPNLTLGCKVVLGLVISRSGILLFAGAVVLLFSGALVLFTFTP